MKSQRFLTFKGSREILILLNLFLFLLRDLVSLWRKAKLLGVGICHEGTMAHGFKRIFFPMTLFVFYL
jgi:hypothetical protein